MIAKQVCPNRRCLVLRFLDRGLFVVMAVAAVTAKTAAKIPWVQKSAPSLRWRYPPTK